MHLDYTLLLKNSGFEVCDQEQNCHPDDHCHLHAVSSGILNVGNPWQSQNLGTI